MQLFCILIAYAEDFFILSQFPKLEEKKCFKFKLSVGRKFIWFSSVLY